jgi:hypothetical protein
MECDQLDEGIGLDASADLPAELSRYGA